VGEIPDFLRSGLSTVSCVIGVLIVYEAVVWFVRRVLR